MLQSKLLIVWASFHSSLLESYLEDFAISGDQEGFEEEFEYHVIGGRI